MKLKRQNILIAVAIVVSAAGWLLPFSRPEGPLRGGELVRHKLHTKWEGVVLENQEGKCITVRWHSPQKNNGLSHVWNDSLDVEWERK